MKQTKKPNKQSLQSPMRNCTKIVKLLNSTKEKKDGTADWQNNVVFQSWIVRYSDEF